MKPILCAVFALLMASWLFPARVPQRYCDPAQFSFIFHPQYYDRKIDFAKVALLDMAVLGAAGLGIVLVVFRK